MHYKGVSEGGMDGGGYRGSKQGGVQEQSFSHHALIARPTQATYL